MTDDPKAALSAALLLDGTAAPLTALRHAVSWTAQSISADVAEDEVAALKCVIGLDSALSDLRGLLSTVPDLVKIASPGQTVQERVTRYREELIRQRAQLAADRAALDAAGDLERQIEQAKAEREQLTVRIGMLERQQHLAEQLPALQARLAALQGAVDEATAAAADQLAAGLIAAMHQLTDLTQEQCSVLGSDLSRLATHAAETGQALADAVKRRDGVTAEMDRRLAEAEQLRREYQEILPALQQYRQADQDLADGLSAAGMPVGRSELEWVREALADIAHRLEDLDGRLKPLLEEQARQYADARRIRNWSG
jgi:DNA repair exonuclease SbcCD ATPase subunit